MTDYRLRASLDEESCLTIAYPPPAECSPAFPLSVPEHAEHDDDT